jgi:phage FluMu protein Com
MIKLLDEDLWTLAETEHDGCPRCKICGWINTERGPTGHSTHTHRLTRGGTTGLKDGTLDNQTVWIQKQRVLR